jgi:hypothetical protein
MVLYNYTSLKTRDTKIYNVGGYNIAGGLSVEFMKVVGPCIIVFIILGCIISIPFGINFLNPLGDNFHPKFTVIMIGLGIAIGCGLWYIQFAGYRLYQYLGAYFKPKKVYMNDFKHTIYKQNNLKYNTMVKNIF